VVGAVEISRRLSSESTVEAGCWNMIAGGKMEGQLKAESRRSRMEPK
jgi:hypothetical protein